MALRDKLMVLAAVSECVSHFAAGCPLFRCNNSAILLLSDADRLAVCQSVSSIVSN